MAIYNELLEEFEAYQAQLLGISVDGVWCRSDGVCERALFVLDRDGVIAWSHLSPIGVKPAADGILDALGHLGERRRSTPRRAEAHP
jgi:peroxiredoxin